MHNPYCFMTDFDNWWLWWVDIHVHGLTVDQANKNMHFKIKGWELLDGMKYGGWTTGPEPTEKLYGKNKRLQIFGVETPND